MNIDADHLDYFKTLGNIIRSFHQFAKTTSRLIIVNGDDDNAMKSVEGITDKQIITFGFDSHNDYYPANIRHLPQARCEYDLMHHGQLCGHMVLSIPGQHNVINSVAAAIVAFDCGLTAQQVAQSLTTFRGAARRFEILGTVNGITIADDYAHHPAELKATLLTAKEMDFGSVWAVFQPFTYSRTYMLLEDFAQVLQLADHVVMSEIMGAREVNTYQIYTKDLAEKIPGSVWYPTFEEMADHVLQHAKPGDLVITLGCGDVYKCAKLMLGAGNPKN